MIKQIIIVVAIVLLSVSAVTGEVTGLMSMERDNDTIIVMINSSIPSMGAQAYIYFDPNCINIIEINVTSSPWQPLIGPGWSHQGDHVVISTANFAGVEANKYIFAILTVDKIKDNCISEIYIENVHPPTHETETLTWISGAGTDDKNINSTIKIGDGSGICTIPITGMNLSNVGSCDISLYYDLTVVKVTGITLIGMDAYEISDLTIIDGCVRFIAYQTDSAGISDNFTFVDVSFEPINAYRDCDLNLVVKTLKDATNTTATIEVMIENGTYYASEEETSSNRKGTYPPEEIPESIRITQPEPENTTINDTLINDTPTNEPTLYCPYDTKPKMNYIPIIILAIIIGLIVLATRYKKP